MIIWGLALGIVFEYLILPYIDLILHSQNHLNLLLYLDNVVYYDDA